jgi:hypothetical protein
MVMNGEGMMWVKLVRPATSATEEICSHRPSSTLIPIRWTVRQRLSATYSDLTTAKPSERATPSDPDEDNVEKRNAESFASNGPAPPRACSVSATIAALEADDQDDADLCVVCMARPPDFQLLPCRHDRFCRQCMVETICTWVRPEAPSCPLCRAAFHTMVLLE